MSKSGRSLFITAAIFLSISLAFADEIWDRHLVLDDDGILHVYWAEKANGVLFKVEAAAKGYVGFGLSPDGGMTGSDIVTGWVADGQVYFQDRHGVGNSFPPVDMSQDWFLTSGWENDTHTSLTFYRKLVTCDPDDIDIDDSTIHLIYSYSHTDPTSEDSLEYHGSNRGSEAVFLLQGKVYRREKLDGIPYWDVKAPGFAVSPDDVSVVWNTICKAPKLNVKHHIIRVQPLIQPGNEKVVSHIAMYHCLGKGLEGLEKFVNHPGFQNSGSNTQRLILPCTLLVTFYGSGGNDFFLPENVGLPLPADNPTYYRLQIHYNTQHLHHNIRDKSGFRVFHTEKLREYDGGTLGISSLSSPSFFFPPHLNDFTLVVHSNPEWFRKQMPPDGIRILAAEVHAHKLGRRIRARHFRGNKELPPLADDKNYSYHNKDYKYYKKEVQVLPSDQITVECSYDSSEKSKVTFMGGALGQEMCTVMFLYYPKIEVNVCFGAPVIPTLTNLTGMPEQELMKQFGISDKADFSNEDVEALDWKSLNCSYFEENLRYAPQTGECYPGGEKLNELVTFPRNFIPYYENPRKCRDGRKGTEEFEKDMDNFIKDA